MASSGEAIVVGQPMVQQFHPAKNRPMRLATPIKIFSAFSITLGILSIGFQIATLVMVSNGIPSYSEYDYIGAGIWCGVIYIVTGGLGVSASIKHTKCLLIASLAMAGVSIACSITAASLSGVTASWGIYSYYYCYYYYNCDAWYGLEWTLFSISCLAFINSITLVGLVSVPVCCGKPKKKTTTFTVPVQQYPLGQTQPQYPVMMMTTTGQMVQVVPNNQQMVQQPNLVQLQPQLLQNYQTTPQPNQDEQPKPV